MANRRLGGGCRIRLPHGLLQCLARLDLGCCIQSLRKNWKENRGCYAGKKNASRNLHGCLFTGNQLVMQQVSGKRRVVHSNQTPRTVGTPLRRGRKLPDHSLGAISVFGHPFARTRMASSHRGALRRRIRALSVWSMLSANERVSRRSILRLGTQIKMLF